MATSNPKLDPTADFEPEEQDVPATAAPAGVQTFDMGALGAAIASGITSTQPKRKVTNGEYACLSAQQPDKRKSLKLTRVCYQNGGFMNPTKLTNGEITLLNQIHRSGRYIDRIVEVIIGRDGSEDAVDFRYNDKSVDQRMENKSHWRSLEHMLQQIVDEQTILDDNDEERASRPLDTRPVVDTARRPFGNSKATKAAREAAGV